MKLFYLKPHGPWSGKSEYNSRNTLYNITRQHIVFDYKPNQKRKAELNSNLFSPQRYFGVYVLPNRKWILRSSTARWGSHASIRRNWNGAPSRKGKSVHNACCHSKRVHSTLYNTSLNSYANYYLVTQNVAQNMLTFSLIRWISKQTKFGQVETSV